MDPPAVVLDELDRSKPIDDRFEHAAGDAVLRDVARRLRGGLRAFDLAYRHGGEESSCSCPGADVTRAEGLAERLRRAVGETPLGRSCS